MRRGILAAALAVIAVLALAGPAGAEAGKGFLFLDGEVYGTTVPPSPLPHGGNDPLFSVTNGVEGQFGIAGVGPGQPGYNGGAWEVHRVTFTVEPYLLTSDEDVMAALAAGDVTVTRDASADFRCPVTFPA
ncbi:MAG TPA: hypothetical protein VFZ45_00100 [Actinomycetota bacterium]|nr:hypothetical protein [Actinomycetota bacterium]